MKKYFKNLKKKLNVWILQTGEPLIIDGKKSRFMRGMNLANKLVDQGHNVLFFSSNFDHQKKLFRYNKNKIINFNSKLSFQLIDSPGYEKNISIKRFYDHLILALNLNKIINQKKSRPDVVFIGYPPIEISYVMSRWLYKRNIPYILDIKDQWPDLIVEIFPKKLHFLIKLILFPYYYCFKQTIKKATSITSMSNSFINWSLKISKKKNNVLNKVIPLVSNKNKTNHYNKTLSNKWCDKNKISNKNSFNILFLGSLSRSFDFETIIKCAKNIQDIKNNKNMIINFIICGDGELKKSLIENSKNLFNIKFMGWVDSDKIASIASRSNIAIAPYKNFNNFKDNIPNKIIDYISFGLPILSPLKGEVSSLIKKKQIGISYKDGSNVSLKNKIYELLNNKKKLNLYSNNAKKLYKSNYTYDIVYGDAVNLIEKIHKNKTDLYTLKT
ncbi:glycosyltransferase family 4 protein [Candidatus Pelagibacter sp. HIMB1623]|uniref:glycosyltransferase family 4 protein n=1 Tax=Candidatus Pelagibacter sp. HIMB1623 TaxID=3413358 RepID=UPI003F849F59